MTGAVSKERLKVLSTIPINRDEVSYYSLSALEREGIASPINRLPYSIRVLLENVLRHFDNNIVTLEDVRELANWQAKAEQRREIPFMPARVILQDFTGVPVVADLAAMRSAVYKAGADPDKINPLVPVDLVIDHSVQVDFFGNAKAFEENVELEYQRNGERYAFLRWAQKAFKRFRVVPPGTGIVHQVNLEYLGQVVQSVHQDGKYIAYPDTVVGTDSHTTMINGIGILGWGVGGIEAEAVMLGQPYYMLIPDVAGVKLTGRLQEGATATDLVLAVTEMLRRHGVVDKFVEFYGPGAGSLSLADRATIANMAPEYGATVGYFPIDEETLHYLAGTGRPAQQLELVEAYAKEQSLFRHDDAPDPEYSETLQLDLKTVEPSLAGPRRPQDRVLLRQMKDSFQTTLKDEFKKTGPMQPAPIRLGGQDVKLEHGAVVIAAITSCTNTSNPAVMVGAGLLARKAVERGLEVKPWVKTSLAPGSRVVIDYLERAGLMEYLNRIRFNLVGFGCTTCIGNSGPLPEPISGAIRQSDMVCAAVLSGNRNFEARINPLVRANYLASPLLVVAYALAGTVDIDLISEPLGNDGQGVPVYLRDIWPSLDEIQETLRRCLDAEMFRDRYSQVFEGDERWRSLPIPESALYQWDASSTYIQEPPFVDNFSPEPQPLQDIRGAVALAVLGDSITTDHISPAGSIAADSPAGRYLLDHSVEPKDFNSYGSRRGNHEVMMRGTLANVRLKNLLASGTEGGWTTYHATGERMTIYDAAMRYKEALIPLIIIAGKEYGAGSSRDWAAKGIQLLGVKAVIAESYERIHRSNLVGMGVLPLQFLPGDNREKLGLTGDETYSIEGIAEDLAPGKELTVHARRKDGSEVSFQVVARINGPVEVDYYKRGGILPAVLGRLLLGNK